MNWIERMYDLKGKDLYSQNGEGFYLEYIANSLKIDPGYVFDYGGGDGFYLSNSRHLKNLGWEPAIFDLEHRFNPFKVTIESISKWDQPFVPHHPKIISIDLDGNDYWILEWLIKYYKPEIVCAEFNPAFTDARTIKYNPDHIWDGTDYYGFSFEAGKKLAFIHGYKIIFQIANMNVIMVRHDLISPNISIPEVKYEQIEFFEKSNREDWVFV